MPDLRLEKMRAVGKLTALCLRKLHTKIQAGMTTKDIEIFVIDFQIKNSLKNSQHGYRDFPGWCCTSVNDVICHGIPSEKDILKNGDIVKVDVTFNLDGFHGDSCYTYEVGEVSPQVKQLIKVTKVAMYRGIMNAIVNEKISIIGQKIQEYVEENGFGIVKDYTGHCIGEEMHMLPQIPHVYNKAYDNLTFHEGQTFTVEPMVTIGSPDYYLSRDGWAVKTRDMSWSAQFEQTCAITDGMFEVLTQ